MDYQLSAKTALVTGSTQGIGYAIAALLKQEGATVYINGRTAAKVDAAIAKLNAEVSAGQALPAVADLADDASLASLLEAVPSVDILVNNTGIFEPKAFFDIPDDDWRRFFEVNVLSGVRLSRHYLRGMLDRNWGRVVFISSESALNIPEEMIHYGMTKTAQLAVSRGLAELTKNTKVTVNAILPGPTRSEGVDEFVNQMARQQKITPAEMETKFFHEARPTSLIQRFATVNEVAQMVAYVASPLSSATNGAALRVDGGAVKTIA